MTAEYVLKQIPFQVDLPTLMQRLHLKDGSRYVRELQDLVQEAQAIARPKVIYRATYVEMENDDGVMIDQKAFKSRIMRVNLDSVQRVFPYVATCGVELDGWQKETKDVLRYFWADTIKELALMSAEQALEEHLREHYGLENIAAMNPGSLEDWPLAEQQPLFELLGDPQAAIGVKLTENFLMLPLKSSSGIRFPSKEKFANCQLCPRENCSSRRTAFDKALFESKFRYND